MKSNDTILKSNYVRRAVICLLTCCLIFNTSVVLAEVVLQPDGIINGDINVTPLGGGITQDMTATDGAIGNFSDFDIAEGHFVNCVQSSANANALFRVYSGDGTQILGRFDATGNIYLIDPAGILFGANSSVNINQLVASSLDISDLDFIAGNYQFIDGDLSTGPVINDGSITAAEGVALIGKHVRNNGTITAGEGGFVVMAAGDRVLLGEPGSNIIVEMDSVTVNEGGDGDIINDGDIEAPAGTVVLAAGDIFSSALELPEVEAGRGNVEQNGTIDADGTNGDGGGICLTAGDEVILASGSRTTANAGTDGDAGLIVVHSEGRTVIESGAQIEATGGHTPNGVIDDVVEATVEISGDQVNLAGDIDASATNGKRGKVMIEAFDMTVADGFMPVSPPDNTVYEKWIEQQSQSATDVELVANSKTQGIITVESIDDGEITCRSGEIVLRTKYDTGGIAFESDDTAIHSTAGGNVYMLAGAGGITTGDIITDISLGGTEPGKIRLYTNNEGDITTGQLGVAGGGYAEISVIADGDLTINGNAGTTTNQLCHERSDGQAKTYLKSVNGNVQVDGTIKARAYGKNSTSAEVLISSGQDILVNPGQNQIEAYARTTQYYKPAEASVLIYAGGEFPRDAGGDATVHVYAKTGIFCNVAEVFSTDPPEDWDETHGYSHALLEIEEDSSGDVPDYPDPPYIVPIYPVPPIALDDAATTHMGDPVSGNVLTNDEDGLTVDSYTQPGHGTVTVDENGEYIYTPDPGYAGNGTPDSFTYVATDGELYSDPATVTINVNNILPSAGDDTATTHMNTDVSGNVLGNDSDPDGDSLVVVLDGITPQHGQLTLNEDGTFTYSPDAGYIGDDSFAYTITDGQLDGGTPVVVTATASITVGNTLPTSYEDSATTNQGSPVTIDVLANDFDPDDDALSVVTDGVVPQHGELTLNDDNTFTYTPDPGYVGEDSFVYAATDGQFGAGLTWTAVKITVNAAALIAAAPLPENVELDISGCPALIQWASNELGIEGEMVQVWIVNTLASSRDIQPCDACANLRAAATVLQDADGTHIAALAQVINEFASSAAPPSEEQMASIADAIANNTESDNAYALAGEYIDALVAYVGILEDLGYSSEDSITVASDKYVAPLAEGDNVGLAAYVAARLTALGG